MHTDTVKMKKMNKFWCGQEVANLVVSSDLLNLSWGAILQCYSHADSGGPPSVVFESYRHQNAIHVAFVTSPASTLHHLQTLGCDFISSEELRTTLAPFHFVCTKLNPSFCIHRAAIALFASIRDQLYQLKQELCSVEQSRLIITGHSLGGSVASLFTLWLLDSLSSKDKKHALCITFGSPLLGDQNFQQAISERPSWNSCFLHVIYKHDPIPWSFIFQQIHVYKPFGTFLLCSESNCSCFEQPEATLESMMAMSSAVAQSQYLSSSVPIDYEQILRCIKSKTVSQGTSLPWNLCVTPLQTGIAMHLEAIGVDMVLQNSNFNSLVTNTERIFARAFKRSAFDPTKKLNEMKKDMIFLEWYKKSMVEEGGYYDSFKNVQFQSGEKIISRQEIIKHKKILERYWKRMVEEAEKMPQKEGIAFRTCWLYAGTNYRRMVEPLDIAEYYRDGKKDYRNGGRIEKFKHYLLLEKWMNEEKPGGCSNMRNKPVSLTEDSCFWGDVEDAVISCKVLRDGQSSIEEKALSRDYLVRFEEYVMKLIESYSVSSEIFLKGSTFRQWWLQYKEIIDPSYTSRLSMFMTNNGYHTYICDEYRSYV